MTNLILKGKSLKGKNRIREFGNEWVVLREHETHGMLITPKTHVDSHDGHLRWFRPDDKDFKEIK